MCLAARVCCVISLLAMTFARAAVGITVNDLGDNGSGDCISTCTLRDAIATAASGETIDFAANLLPGTIALSKGELVIDRPLTLQGPGAARLTISAGGTSRVINAYWAHSSAVALHVQDLTLRAGVNSVPDAGNGTPGTGAAGGSSGTWASGGCMAVFQMTLVLERAVVRDCMAVGGKGGDGGSGTPGVGLLTAGTGGAGGPGTSADGGCIDAGSSNSSKLLVRDSSLINCQAIGGAAGRGGDGGLGSSPAFNGTGGAGGYGGFAQGGAIYFIGKGTLSIYNSTIADSTASSGDGGDGGTGNPSLVTAPGGDGGGGGGVNGGLVFSTNYNQETGNAVELVFATLSNGTAAPGAGGSGGAGATPGQAGSTNPFNDGAAIDSASATALSTVIVGAAQLPLCDSPMTASGLNLDEDSSCGFAAHGTLAQLFRPLDANAASPAYMPAYHSVVIDAAYSCDDLDFLTLTADQDGTPRPQGNACDLGAIEADYIFLDPFE